VGNSVLDQGIEDSLFSARASIADVIDLPARFFDTFDEVVFVIDGTAEGVFDLLLSIPEDLVGDDGDLGALVDDTSDILIQMQITIDTLFARAKEIVRSSPPSTKKRRKKRKRKNNEKITMIFISERPGTNLRANLPILRRKLYSSERCN